MNRPRVCIFCFSNISWDRRVLRQIDFARRQFQVDVIGYGEKPFDDVNFYPLSPYEPPKIDRYRAYLAGRLAPKEWERLFWQYPHHQEAYRILREQCYDLVHANDWDAYVVAAKVGRGLPTRVLFDAHENYLEQYAEKRSWKLLIAPFREYLMRAYGGGMDGMITVSEAFADWYKSYFGWESRVILSAPVYVKSEFRPVDPNNIQLVHHGIAMVQRHIDKIIEVVSLLDERFKLNLILMYGNTSDNTPELKQLAQRIAPGRVVFHDPVEPDRLMQAIQHFDIGIPFMHFRQQNYFNTLPNKFFDYIMAGLALSVSPQPMMKRIVEENGIGVVSADQEPASMAEKLRKLSPQQIEAYKRSSLCLAQTVNAETEMGKLMGIYEDLLR